MMMLNRRSLVKAVGAAALAAPFAHSAVAATSSHGPRLPSRANLHSPAWPGHRVGQVYLGVHAHADDLDRTLEDTGPVGVHRTFYQWDVSNREVSTITSDHASRRLPWVSFKPPGGTWHAWEAIGNGQYDEDIRARARVYAEFAQPIIVTFHHEPTDDAPSQGAAFSKAWCRIHDVMADETALQNVVSVPITTDWIFDDWNKQDDPREWATPEVLDRCHFFGVDTYQQPSQRGNEERVGPLLDYLDSRGHGDKMVGIGETGATDDLPGKSGAEWWQEQWAWAEQNADRVGVISYYNYVHPRNSQYNWSLWQSQSKLSAFQDSLASPIAATSLSSSPGRRIVLPRLPIY